ncbi:hypothetical protein [Aureispira anguillae]|uniref:Uncharacterized protein n=1 Tax=Aureispira anguillae TaxID=2864201 RepID=A0A915YDI2_9BACT|nr:hypothetical protein [Aureispira anguillae]BDS11083.1 hypothetical protein AsAng_0017940 [Aureispira anguillae]
MEHLEDLLDDSDINNKELAAVNKELKGLEYWLYITGLILLIGGTLVALVAFKILLKERYYMPGLIPLAFSGISIAGVTAGGLAYTHFRYASAIKEFRGEESPLAFEKVARKSLNDWRLFFVFAFFITLTIGGLIAVETYEKYAYTYELKEDREAVEEFMVPDEEFPLQEAFEEGEELDPAPPSN